MSDSVDSQTVRVSQRFDASAERVYDAFLDPRQARHFMFATPTGQIVRCEIDARVGAGFTIVDRRAGIDVVHTGEFITLDRPRAIAFTFFVGEQASARTRVDIEITPLQDGCELTLSHALPTADAHVHERARDGWRRILELAAEVVTGDTQTCGRGIARHASVPAALAVMFEGLAETLELHRRMLVRDDENARGEDVVYAELATKWREIASRVAEAAATMAAQRDLPMGAHDESAWGDEHHRAFEKFVRGQSHALALLRVAAERDEQMLAGMTPHTTAAGTKDTKDAKDTKSS